MTAHTQSHATSILKRGYDPHSAQAVSSVSSHDVLTALRQYHRNDTDESPFARLAILYTIQQHEQNQSRRHTTNVLLRKAQARLQTDNEPYARLLERRFMDNITASAVANELNVSESKFYLMQKAAVAQLTAILQEMESEAQRQRIQMLVASLELTPDVHLIGIDEHLDIVTPKLTHPSADWIVALEGIGGIGKTTLADTLVRHVIRSDLSWQKVAWVTARQLDFQLNGDLSAREDPALTVETLLEQLYDQLLTDIPRPADFDNERVLAALKQHLTEQKCLIVIDNLETLVDVESLLPTLRRLMNPTKFILTSRQSSYAEGGVFHYSIPQLSLEQALALVRREATTTNLPEVAAATNADLEPIYDTVGGNPLALRLVVGQLHIYGLNEILADLQEARGAAVENLYTFVYRKIWDSLDEPARRALIAMILVNESGDTFADLLATSDLVHNELQEALKQLVTLNLVDSRGGLLERRYTIHNLTRSFLHKQVVLWQ